MLVLSVSYIQIGRITSVPAGPKQVVLVLSVSYIQIGHTKSVPAGTKGHSDEKRPKRFKFNKNEKDVNVSVYYEECVSVVCSVTLRLSLRRQISVRGDSKAVLHCTVLVFSSKVADYEHRLCDFAPHK